jgi:hypothetical protein
VCQRILRFAKRLGKENAIAGADCGFGGRTHPQIAWAKLAALVEGARLASDQLWWAPASLVESAEVLFETTVALTGMLSAAIASVSGFGIGSLLTPVVASAYGMKTAVAAVAIPHALATFLRFWRLRAHVDGRVLRGFGLVNAAGSLAGAVAQRYVDNTGLSAVLGGLLIFAGLAGISGLTQRMRFGGRAAWMAGALSGGFGGLVGNQGGIRAAAMLGMGVEGVSFVATATAIGLLVDAARLPVYVLAGAGEIAAVWPVIAAAGAGVVFGTLAGEPVLRRIPARWYRSVVAALLIALGLFLLWSNGRGGEV